MSAYLSSFLSLLVILLVHLKAEDVLGHGRFRATLLTFIAGVAIAYAFVDVFPHLAEKQRSLDAIDASDLTYYLSHHLYLVALGGFCVYVCVRVFSESEINQHHSRLAYLLIVASMCFYALLTGYLLGDIAQHRPEPAVLFAIAMGAHFLGLHHELIDTRPDTYARVVRYLLIASTLLGWAFSYMGFMSQAFYMILFAYITGGIVAVSAISDLPRINSIEALGPFLAGALLFSGLLLSIEAFSKYDLIPRAA